MARGSSRRGSDVLSARPRATRAGGARALGAGVRRPLSRRRPADDSWQSYGGETTPSYLIGRGTHNGDLVGVAPTGKTVAIPVCDIYEIRDGKIYREREYIDFMTLMVQLGVAAAPSVAVA
ncbi:MAG: hypothetical protein EPO22_14970 [Dehalococcoidia bacterium]|nr:MAG: hypothetical protein EPO22_14970 [Dehalococcoidia bacterium]